MSHYSRLCRARDYLAARFNERTSLAEAAVQAGLSPFYFHRLFAETFGETPHQFVARLRIEHAKKLLLGGNHSVTDICLESGYESLGSFSSRFHSLTGLSPAAFRRESRRVFGTSGRNWPLYYMPACFQHFFVTNCSAAITDQGGD
jgi:AraC-like DNA-binding protein